jgi:hypothetical protein
MARKPKVPGVAFSNTKLADELSKNGRDVR